MSEFHLAVMKMLRLATVFPLALALALASPALSAEDAAITQPLQPASGPGGFSAAYTKIQRQHVGEAPEGAWIFMPAGATPDHLSAFPVVLFVHGFLALDPETYGGWIDHLVRRGTIVIYPDYQSLNVLKDPPGRYLDDLLSGTRVAIQSLERSGVRGMRMKRFDVVGHSLGGVLAVQYAQRAERLGFPAVSTLTSVEPGGCVDCGPSGPPLPSNLLVQVIVGSDDTTVGDTAARKIWPLARDIPAAHRDYVTIESDEHGIPPLIADHEMVGTGGPNGEENALDWYGLWRPLDALIACATSGTYCSTALGNTLEHRDMGAWSDGTPVTPLRITDGPA